MHIQAYNLHGRPPVKGRPKEKCWGVEHIIGEGLRLPGFCSHVERPLPPEVIAIDSPVDDPMGYADWIASTMAECREQNGATLRRTALALGTIIVSLPSDESINKVYDLRELAVNFFKRFLALHQIKADYSVVHLDESNPHVHIWATPSKKQYENNRWSLGGAFNLPGMGLTQLQDLYWHEVGIPLGLDRKNEIPRGRRFSRNTLKAFQTNPMAMRYSPLYEAGFLNALDRVARYAPLPHELLFEVIRDELDEESVERLKTRLGQSEIAAEHYTLRDTQIEPAKPSLNIAPKLNNF